MCGSAGFLAPPGERADTALLTRMVATRRARLHARGHSVRTASDTEVVAHLWQEQGEAAVEELDGMFGLAVWDARRETLSLARDRMGEKPLYWAHVDGWFVFASELRAVRAHPAVDATPSADGVLRYLTYDYVPDPHTISDGVHKLPPAHVLTIASDGKLH